jgi:hypothetical protein
LLAKTETPAAPRPEFFLRLGRRLAKARIHRARLMIREYLVRD